MRLWKSAQEIGGWFEGKMSQIKIETVGLLIKKLGWKQDRGKPSREGKEK